MITKSKIYKGIEYVQLSELPLEQQELFTTLPNKDFIIKIQVEGKILHDCIQFKDYTNWYEGQFSIRSVTSVKISETDIKKNVSSIQIEEFATEKA